MESEKAFKEKGLQILPYGILIQMHQDHVIHAFLLSLLRVSGSWLVAGETEAAAVRSGFSECSRRPACGSTVPVNKTKYPRSTSDLNILFGDLGASSVFCSHRSPTALVGGSLSLLHVAKFE